MFTWLCPSKNIEIGFFIIACLFLITMTHKVRLFLGTSQPKEEKKWAFSVQDELSKDLNILQL